MLSPSFGGNVAVENEFGIMIGELEGGERVEQAAEITFTCKLCDFR